MTAGTGDAQREGYGEERRAGRAHDAVIAAVARGRAREERRAASVLCHVLSTAVRPRRGWGSQLRAGCRVRVGRVRARDTLEIWCVLGCSWIVTG